MITVNFENGQNILFDADSWNFRNVEHNNVYITKNEIAIAHINWDKVLCISYQERIELK